MIESPEEFEAVEQLLRERDALHGWLERLDALGSATPEAVRVKVRADYERRLADLTSGLREHGDTISVRLAEDRAEHADLSARATVSRDALAEAELRHAVGEYSQAHFEAERTRHTSDLETFELSLAAVAERIARLEAVEALARRPLATGAPESALPSEPDAPAVSEPAEATGSELTSELLVEIEAEAVPMGELAPEETDSLLAVFDEATEAPGQSALPEPVSPRPPVADHGPLSFTPSGAGGEPRPGPRANTIPPLGMPPAVSAPPRFVRPGERLAGDVPPPPPPPPPSPAARPFLEEEIVAAGPPPEPISVPVSRTLRCGECGAMNKPLEWYCEKCGAELTAT
jgi:hypothetical protein